MIPNKIKSGPKELRIILPLFNLFPDIFLTLAFFSFHIFQKESLIYKSFVSNHEKRGYDV